VTKSLAKAPTKIEYVEQIAGTSHVVRGEITRNGQQLPSVGDSVVVMLRISLPRQIPQSDRIANDLQFGLRVSLLGESMAADWGNGFGLNEKYREIQIVRPTYAEAFAAAEEAWREAIAPLLAAAQARAEALVAAG